MFELLKVDPNSKARLGRLTTAHGLVDTPVFMSVGTQGSVKALDPRELRESYRQQVEQYLAAVRRGCNDCDAEYHAQMIDVPYSQALVDLLSRRG